MHVKAIQHSQRENVLPNFESVPLGMRSAPLRFGGNRNVKVKGLTRPSRQQSPQTRADRVLLLSSNSRPNAQDRKLFRAFLGLGQAPAPGSPFNLRVRGSAGLIVRLTLRPQIT
jgi:hypothetical protein